MGLSVQIVLLLKAWYEAFHCGTSAHIAWRGLSGGLMGVPKGSALRTLLQAAQQVGVESASSLAAVLGSALHRPFEIEGKAHALFHVANRAGARYAVCRVTVTPLVGDKALLTPGPPDDSAAALLLAWYAAQGRLWHSTTTPALAHWRAGRSASLAHRFDAALGRSVNAYQLRDAMSRLAGREFWAGGSVYAVSGLGQDVHSVIRVSRVATFSPVTIRNWERVGA